jgi:hypothetical protein
MMLSRKAYYEITAATVKWVAAARHAENRIRSEDDKAWRTAVQNESEAFDAYLEVMFKYTDWDNNDS